MNKISFVTVLLLTASLTAYVAGQNTTAPSSPTGMTAAQSDSNSSSGVSSKSGATDASLTQQLQGKLSQDPAFANVQGSVASGTALITGTVVSKADKKRADDLAKSISGIKHVTDQLTVNASAGASTSSKNNNQTDVNSVTSPNAGVVSGTPGATNPSSGETSATSTNPQSQASGTTGSTSTSEAAGTTAVNPKAAGQISSTNPNMNSTQSSTPAATGSSAGQAAGENASSAPQAPSTGAAESNMAGATSSQSASSIPATSGGVTGTATANPSNTTQMGANAGSIGTNAGASSVAGSTASGTTGVGLNDTATLQGQIQTALQNEPTLRNDALSVNVTDNTIELSGNVQTGKEKQTAHRIASSFAGNRRVKDRITLTGHGSSASSNPNSGGLGANPAGNPSNNPANNQNSNPKTSQNPSANNPAANGDASANPR
jgi:osmotically-inducible protein OsmY